MIQKTVYGDFRVFGWFLTILHFFSRYIKPFNDLIYINAIRPGGKILINSDEHCCIWGIRNGLLQTNNIRYIIMTRNVDRKQID